ncbi:hypothetical protein [Methylocystis sp. SC2]|uniref:hypothetical protein n=1 Tax=Methylocystis sp. (strain SC2) TaxID=187303 RepID=UPI0005A4EE7C|nr:hypothetical protein [Methylocystis sp. SC2]
MTFIEGDQARLFSRLYLEHGPPTRDSARMRRRLVEVWPAVNEQQIASWITKRLGVEVPRDWHGEPVWSRYLSDADLRDVLDAITIAFLVSRDRKFLIEVATIFREENVGYRVDEQGVVHFAVDVEFERAVQSTIRGLDDPRYGNVIASFKRIQPELNKDPPDGKQAIRASFDAVEALFKLMFSRAHRLGGGEAQTHLAPLVTDRSEEGAERRAALKWVSSFKEWIEACHFYRHEQGQPEPHQPHIDLAIALISGGITYLRWLATFDRPRGDQE